MGVDVAATKPAQVDATDLVKALERRRLVWWERALRWLLAAPFRAVWSLLGFGWHRRRVLAPLIIAAAAWPVAVVAHLVDRGWLTVLLAGAVFAPVVYWRVGWPSGRWTRRRRRKPLEHRIWYSAAYTALVVWVAVAAAWRLGPPMPGFWGVAAVAVFVRWAWHHRARHEVVAVPGAREADWPKVRKLAGTSLTGVEDHYRPDRWEADVDLSTTDHLVLDVVAALPHIAKVYGVPQGNVIADYKPGRIETAARLTVVRTNPCDDPVEYDESWIPTAEDIAEGVVPFHAYPNGQRGKVRIFLPGAGAVNSMASGDIRSGKSGGMETLGIQAMWTGWVWPMAADPQGGVSMPAMCGAEGVAPWQALDDDAIFNQLVALEEAMWERGEALARFPWVDDFDEERVGLRCWDPVVTGWPAVAYLFDEGHLKMKDPDFAPRIKRLLKMMGKVGFFMVFATQYPGVDEFGNDMAMRQCLTAGNKMAYRNTDGTTKEMILAKHMPSPFNIPTETVNGGHTKGMLVCESQAPRSSLPVYSRTVWPRRNVHWARRAAERIPGLDPVTAKVFERYMTNPASREPEPEREQITVVAKNGRKSAERIIDRIVGYLNDRGRCPTGQAPTGVIQQALGEKRLSTVYNTLKRGIPKGDVHEVRAGEGIWAAGPTPIDQHSREKEALPV